MTYLLALDQGTSSSRSIVFDKRGHIVAQAQLELPQIYPQPEVYQPERWLDDDRRRELTSRNLFVQFGYGQHRCLGEMFANTMLKTTWSLLLRDHRLHGQPRVSRRPGLPTRRPRPAELLCGVAHLIRRATTGARGWKDCRGAGDTRL